FNQYHSYTVDEHTLRAVEAAERVERDDSPLGEAYRHIQHKELLHLALLLHDLGKGHEEDHSEVGRRIALAAAERLRLPGHQRDALVFLVHKHLLMTHLATRRDISDPDLLAQFSRQVGSADTLRMLYVLSAADLTAVGPGVFTGWKADLLAELFDSALLILSGSRGTFHQAKRLDAIRAHVRSLVSPLELERNGRHMMRWMQEHLDHFPPHYLSATNPDRIAADLLTIRNLTPGEIVVEGGQDAESGTVEYRILLHERTAPGCFHRMTGTLTAKRLQILSAQISTSRDGVVVDGFRVIDPDYSGPVPQERIDDIRGAIRSVLLGETRVETMFQRNRRFQSSRNAEPISELPTRVIIDNDSSDACTIIDIFAHDRPGLLYTVSRAIFELGLSVVLAKIATHFDQVLDVFYVTDADGRKLHDGDRLRTIRETLATTIEAFEREGRRRFAP
ncbi:MAG: ACT domain-containing protein, partial [Planctomycetaceae bacterium]